MRIGLIHNPSAGSAELIGQFFGHMPGGSSCQVFALGEGGGAADATTAALDAGVERLVVAGGDGTIQQVVHALAPEFPPIELALLPLGTGNDLARSLDLRNEPEATIEAIYGHEAVPIDVVRLSMAEQQCWFVNVANGGFGGRVARDVSSENKDRWGPLAYWMSGIAAIAQPKAYEVELTVDEEQHQLTVCGLAVANGRFVGGGFPVAPSARLDDGLLDVTTVAALPPFELMAAGVDFSLGLDPRGDEVQAFRGKDVRLRSEPAMQFSVDGEPLECSEARYELRAGALQIVPGANPPALGTHGEKATGWRWDVEARARAQPASSDEAD